MKSLPSEEELKKQIMLTSVIVWHRELTDKDLEAWLSNFTGQAFDRKYERQIALWLLANFVYYNDAEVKHLCKTLYKDFVHYMLQKNSGPKMKVNEPCIKLFSKLKFYHLGRPGESGAYILYYFRQENCLPIDNFISDPSQLPAEVKTVVFVDDVTLSADTRSSQAFIYLKKAVKTYFREKTVILITLIASEKAKQFLNKEGIEVISCITLDERNRCFSEESNVFRNFYDHRDNCEKVAMHYGRKINKDHPLGFNNGQYMFGFFFNTPDNTLPIFWSEDKGWQPILKRYEKKHSKGQHIELERFV